MTPARAAAKKTSEGSVHDRHPDNLGTLSYPFMSLVSARNSVLPQMKLYIRLKKDSF